MRKAVTAILCLVIGFVLGLLAPYQINLFKNNKPLIVNTSNSTEVRESGYRLISPLLECEYAQEVGDDKYAPSRKKITDLVNKYKNDNKITDASVYYRDLNNGPWFGINEKYVYAPASLLKLPVLIAYLDKADDDPSILQKKLKFEKRWEAITQDFVPEKNIELGKTYTVDELLSDMIVFSDNQALYLLVNNIETSYFDNLTSALGIETITSGQQAEDFMTVKSYAALYRVLFNASFLSKKNSEKALELLTKSTFDRGIKHGIPQDIPVAHKFGERVTNEIKQLHDCGIIYFPKHPYLLCVMTRGNNFDDLSTTIENVSQAIYADLKDRYKE